MLPLLAFLPVILAKSFGMTAELLRVDWREGCLTTAGCAHPRFKLVKNMLSFKEEISISWPVSEDSPRPFVSHWANGAPENLILSCQVVGTDPTYGFPRICDQTAPIRVFGDKPSSFECENNSCRAGIDDRQVQGLRQKKRQGKKLFEIRAKCFSVTISVQKHMERCPWCHDPSEETIIEQKLSEDVPLANPTSVFMRLLVDDNIMPLSMLFLAGIAVTSSLGIACVLVAFLRLERTSCHISAKASPQPRSRPNLVKIPIRTNAPSEQTRPLIHWLSSSSSEATTTSPLDSASSISTRSSIVIPHLSGSWVYKLGPDMGLNARQGVGKEEPLLRVMPWMRANPNFR